MWNGCVKWSNREWENHYTACHITPYCRKTKTSCCFLEDPIEILDDSYLQLQINEQSRFSYEEGIRQLLRHDPDVIMIGEIRDVSTARMVLRCALSGHMVFTTVHAKSCEETLKRIRRAGNSKRGFERYFKCCLCTTYL